MNAPSVKWVLVVEDDADLRCALVEILGKLGVKAIGTGTVADALFKLRNQEFSCVVLDIHLENRSGEEVIKAMRSSDKLPNFKSPILIVSGKVDRVLIQNFKKDIAGVLLKPFEREDFLSKVRQLIGLI